MTEKCCCGQDWGIIEKVSWTKTISCRFCGTILDTILSKPNPADLAEKVAKTLIETNWISGMPGSAQDYSGDFNKLTTIVRRVIEEEK